jgi:hypothetical protein
LNTLDLKKFLLPESNEVDDVNKANSNETVYASDPLPVTDTSTDTIFLMLTEQSVTCHFQQMNPVYCTGSQY